MQSENGKSETTEIERLRAEQSSKVMPLIGQLIDAWDGLPNDLKTEIEDTAESFTLTMHEIIEAMERHHYV